MILHAAILMSCDTRDHLERDAGTMQGLGCWVDERVGSTDDPPSSMNRPQPAVHDPAHVSSSCPQRCQRNHTPRQICTIDS